MVVVIGFNAIMLMLLEIPLLGYTFRLEQTTRKVKQFQDWIARRGRIVGVRALVLLVSAPVLRAAITVSTS